MAAYTSKPPKIQPGLKIRKFNRCSVIAGSNRLAAHFDKQLLCEENDLCFRTYKHIIISFLKNNRYSTNLETKHVLSHTTGHTYTMEA